MCCALDMPRGARGDLYHIEAKLYRLGKAHISILRSKNIDKKCLIPGVFQGSGIFKLFLRSKDPLAGLGDIFCGKIHTIDPEALSVQVFQRAR